VCVSVQREESITVHDRQERGLNRVLLCPLDQVQHAVSFWFNDVPI